MLQHFKETGVSITVEGKRHLGAAIGKQIFIESYVQRKVSKWVGEIESLSSIATSQPHAAYTAFTHGLAGKWAYSARTIPNVEDVFKPLEDIIRKRFLPSITSQNAIGNKERDLMVLPTRLGELGIADPSKLTASQHTACGSITAPLVELIVNCSEGYTSETKAAQTRAKNRTCNFRRQQQNTAAIELKAKLPSHLQRATDVSSEKGASSWLSTLPIAEHGFALHKGGAFRDALCLRYGWYPTNLPSHCVCGNKLNVEHALSCPRGGFPSIRPNENRDITASLMSEVCHAVGTEPCLQPVIGELLTHRTANREEGAHLDIMAQSFWGRDI